MQLVSKERPMTYLYLCIAIAGEVAATSALKASEDFTKLVPSLIVIVGYAIALFFLSITLRTLAVGVAYALWAGVGTLLIAVAGYVIYGQQLTPQAMLGMSFIAIGVALVKTSADSLM